MVADVKSILIYFGALSITLILLNKCSKVKTQNAYLKFLIILITTLPLSLLAGLRDPSVGTDSYNYMMIFHSIYNESFSECLMRSDYETGFVLFIKILSVIFGEDDSVIFFCLESASLVVLIYALLKLKDRLNPCVAFFLYFLMFYHTSLNIVRQTLAISLITLMIVKLVEKKYFQSIIILFASISIHLSSIVAVLFLFAAVLLRKYKKLSIKRILYFFALAVMLVIFYLFWGYITKLSFFMSYSSYIGESYNIGIGVFVSGFLYFAFPLLLYRDEIFSNYETEVLFDISVLFVPIAFLGYFAEYAARLNLFPRMALILFVSHLIYKIKLSQNRKFVMFFYFAFFIMEYIKNYMIFNQTNAYPYLFDILR